MDKIIKLHDIAEEQVRNHSIYVWGASGQLCKDINEKWIRDKESRSDGGKHADDAVASWRAVMDSEYADVARAFDCSGYVSYCLKQIGALKDRTNCDGLYAKCEPTETVENGTLLFRVNPKDPNDETHVGMYFDGKQYHAKGREDGVVAEAYKSSYWTKAAWFKALPKDEPQPEPEPTPEPQYRKVVYVKGGSVYVRTSDSIAGAKIGVAHRGDKLPYLGTGASGWYHVEFKGRDGYISNKPRYTEVRYVNT